MKTLYPVFLELRGRRVLVVGGGPVAASKLDGLLAVGARVTVVAPRVRDELRRPEVVLHERAFEPADVDGAWFVVAAAPPAVNREVSQAAEARGVFVNAVDDADHASAYLGGVLRRAGVTVAVSTEGRAPALAGLLREGLEALLPDDLGRWVELAQARREAWLAARVPLPERRPMLLRALNELYEARPAEARP